jgi:hypothetical protein
MSIEILSMNLAAGVPQEFYLSGEYFEVLDAPYPLDVTLKDRNGVPLSILRNAEASFFTRPGKYGTIVVQSANAQAVRVLYGSGDTGTRRTAGVVQVVDGGKARTISGVAFMNNNGAAGVAAQYSLMQLWNPAGSGKNLILKAYSAAMATAGGISAGEYSTALGSSAAGFSKLLGGAAGVGQVRSGSLAAGGATGMDYFLVQALVTVGRTLQEPIVIPPGKGFAIQGGQLNATLNGAFEWVEETI